MVDPVAEGGGTDAAFASLKTKAPVIERFGLQGFGAHSIDAEYVLIASIEPRLYLTTRLIMDVVAGQGAGRAVDGAQVNPVHTRRVDVGRATWPSHGACAR